MSTKYRLDDRVAGMNAPTRLNPRVVNPELNAKLGPRWPSPLVRETDRSGCLPEDGKGRRRAAIGLPSRLENKD